MVGAPGFEPGTSGPPCQRANQTALRPDFRSLEIIACSNEFVIGSKSALGNFAWGEGKATLSNRR